MLRSLRLVHYKGFRNIHIRLDGDSILVGANNAGKSSVISALRLVAALIPLARRINPSTTGTTQGRITRGWPVTQAALDNAAFSDENVRYDFRPAETRCDAEFSSGAHLIIVWPAIEDDGEPPRPPFFYVTPPPRFQGNIRVSARDHLPDIAIVPTLSPVDDHEDYVLDETIRRNLTGRRTSRYFRNALFREMLDSEHWREFNAFLLSETPEISSFAVSRRLGYQEDELDAFYTEPGQRGEREITWAGDGIQIWIQVLYHIWRQRDSTVLVLDEPDVYLHPDLQRRLARLIFSRDAQAVMATHSIDILAETEPGSAVWIDRSRPRTERSISHAAMSEVGRRLGSAVELSLARALRGRVALFVEGQDLQLMSVMAETVGASRVAKRAEYATVPLGGFTRHWLPTGFAEVLFALGSDIKSVVLLDGDLRSSASRDAVRQAVVREGVDLHIWERRELENYVISLASLSNAASISESDASSLMAECLESLRDEALTSLQTQRLTERRELGGSTSGLSEHSVLKAAGAEFSHIWSSDEGKLSVVDAKKLISTLNGRLQSRGDRTVSAMKLAKALPLVDIPDEAANYFHHFEYVLEQAVGI